MYDKRMFGRMGAVGRTRTMYDKRVYGRMGPLGRTMRTMYDKGCSEE